MRRHRGWLAAAGLLAALVAGNLAAYAHNAQADLSAAHRFSLTPETGALVRNVRSPMKVLAFLNASGPAARDARFLLARYHELNRQITSSVLDPDANPGQARRYGISKYSTVVVTYRGRRVDAPEVDELDISTAILRLLRGRTHTICVLTGHGEAALDDTTPDGLSKVADALRHNADEPRPLDLTTGTPSVPSDCAAVFVLGPRDPLGAQEVAALDDYAKRAGRLFVAASPISGADPNPLINGWGVRFIGGLVLDPARSQGLDYSSLVIEDLPSVNPVDDGVSRLQFPASGGLSVQPDTRDGLTVSPLAATSGKSWVESNPDVESTFDAGDLPGPVVVAAAADDSRVEATGEQRVPGQTGPRIVRTRVLVTGSDVWLSNRFLDSLSNRRFLVNALGWLTQEEQLIAPTRTVSQDRPLPLTSERQARILVVTVGVVPGLILAAGFGARLLGGRLRRVRTA